MSKRDSPPRVKSSSNSSFVSSGNAKFSSHTPLSASPSHSSNSSLHPVRSGSGSSISGASNYHTQVTTMHQCAQPLSPHEEALQSLCKQILKSRLFRGFYEERRYVEPLNGYRDIVALQRGERELQKVLLDICNKLALFYQQTTPPHWIGISHGGEVLAPGRAARLGTLETCIWTELDDLAFGQYWFSIKTLRFRDREIVLKLKMVRPVEAESSVAPIRRRLSSSTSTERQRAISHVASTTTMTGTTDGYSSTAVRRPSSSVVAGRNEVSQAEIHLQDFVEIAHQWGTNIKLSAYEFFANDISKDNLKAMFRFIGLLLVSLLSGLVAALKFLGVFTIRFMFELSRLAHVLTPITLKLIDFCNKIVGGFYILLTMIWKDAIVNRGGRTKEYQPALEYSPPAYQSIEYNVHKQQRRHDEFERKLQ